MLKRKSTRAIQSFSVVVNMKRNSCVCVCVCVWGPRELFIIDRVVYILLNIVLDAGDDDDNNINSNTSLVTVVIVDTNLTRLVLGCMTATFYAMNRLAYLVVLCSCFVYGKYF
jgi:hypothetical protein